MWTWTTAISAVKFQALPCKLSRATGISLQSTRGRRTASDQWAVCFEGDNMGPATQRLPLAVRPPRCSLTTYHNAIAGPKRYGFVEDDGQRISARRADAAAARRPQARWRLVGPPPRPRAAGAMSLAPAKHGFCGAHRLARGLLSSWREMRSTTSVPN